MTTTENCGEACANRKEEKHDFRAALNERGHGKKAIGVAGKHGLAVLAKYPVAPGIAAVCDAGAIGLFDENWFDPIGKLSIEILQQDISGKGGVS